MIGSGLTGLVAMLYEAACDAEQIDPFVAGAADYFGAQRAAFCVWPRDNPGVFVPICSGMPSQEMRRLFDERHEPDSLFWKLGKRQPDTTFLDWVRLSDDSAVRVLCGTVNAGGDTLCSIVLMRDADHDDFSPSVQETLQILLNYLTRSLSINKRFVRMTAQNHTARSILEFSPRGIAIFGQNGQLTFQNAEARRILADPVAFLVTDGMLRVMEADKHAELYQFLERLRDQNEKPLGAERLSSRVERPDGKSAFQMLIYGLPYKGTQAALDEHESLAVMLIHDSTRPEELDPSLLQDYYGFTAAEARLGQSLHSGLALNEAAESLSISINTARTQLRNMFKKAGVNSQAMLLLSFCASPRLNVPA